MAPAITGNESAAEIILVNEEEERVGSVVIPAGAVDPAATQYAAKVLETNYNANITVGADMKVIKYDVSVDGLKAGNTTPVTVQLMIGAGLDPATVVVYHYDDPITSTYNPNTGYVTFETATFSPFTIVFDAESEYVPSVTPDGVPVATVPYTFQ